MIMHYLIKIPEKYWYLIWMILSILFKGQRVQNCYIYWLWCTHACEIISLVTCTVTNSFWFCRNTSLWEAKEDFCSSPSYPGQQWYGKSLAFLQTFWSFLFYAVSKLVHCTQDEHSDFKIHSSFGKREIWKCLLPHYWS